LFAAATADLEENCPAIAASLKSGVNEVMDNTSPQKVDQTHFVPSYSEESISKRVSFALMPT
jgi:hypothetical protein